MKASIGNNFPTRAGALPQQEPFSRVAPVLTTALLMGAGVGFVLAAILTLTLAVHVSIGAWWTALAQAHGHVQLYGWAGLFVVGVALHFLPRLRGAALALPRLVPWMLATLIAGLLLRVLSQPLLFITGSLVWAILLVMSGVLECVAIITVVSQLAMTAWRGPAISTRPAFLGVFPFLLGAFCALAIASCVNVVSVMQAATSSGLVPTTTDSLNVTLGLFGFLVPMALAMSAQSLPMYAGLQAFPRPILWPLASAYFSGLILAGIGSVTYTQQSTLTDILNGLGLLLMGLVLLIFISIFIRTMRTRGKIPDKVARLSPSPAVALQNYQHHISNERNKYGPFVALVASAYMWALLASIFLIIDAILMIFGQTPFFGIDVVRHALAVGFITLLICGISPRMLPGFSGGKIVSPALVSATLWLGNIAAFLRVGSLLLVATLTTVSVVGGFLYSILFGLSGPFGLALAICLAINLWPALWPDVKAKQPANM